MCAFPADAARAGLSLTGRGYRDPSLAGLAVKRVHIQSCVTERSADGTTAIGIAAIDWDDLADAVHITELRSQLDAARAGLGLTGGGYTDPSLAGLAVKRIHVQQLRDQTQ